MSDRVALDRVADLIATHHDHVWGRLPFLGPLAARVDGERAGRGGPLAPLIVALRDLLLTHLHREDRVLLAIASGAPVADLAPRAARLRREHRVVADLLDRIRGAVGGDFRTAVTASPAERALRGELADLDDHLRAQIRIEERLLADPVASHGPP